MSAALPAACPSATNRPTVYFDGGCPLCRREIAVYRRARGAEALRWCDLSDCPDEALGPGLDRAAALSRLHARDADGTLVHGARAFLLIWASLPAFRPLARLGRLPGVRPALDLAYAFFLRLRPLWRPQPACALPPARDDTP